MADRIGRAIPLAVIGAAGVYLLLVTAVIGNDDIVQSAKDGPKYLASKNSISTNYTGLKDFDETLVLLISFFRATFARQTTYLLLLAFGGSLITTVSIIFIESSRWQNLGTLLSFTAFPAGLASQFLGAGIVFPLWFAYASLFSEDINVKAADPSEKSLQKEAKATAALVPAMLFFVGFSGFFIVQPKAFQLPSRTEDIISAIWQVYPLWITLIAFVIRLISPAPRGAAQSADATRTAVGTILFISGASACMLYYTTVFFTFFEARYARKSVVEAFMAYGQFPTKAKDMADIAQFFLSWDAVLSLSATLIFVSGFGDGSSVTKLLTLTVLSVIISPGGAAAWEYWRSGWPEQTYAKDKKEN